MNLLKWMADAPGQTVQKVGLIATGLFAVLAWMARDARFLPTGWFNVIVSFAFFAAAVVFAYRRSRFVKLFDMVGSADPNSPEYIPPASSENTPHNGTNPNGRTFKPNWLRGVSAWQERMTQRAGGLQNAPYLKDDLRITLALFVMTAIAIPISALGAFGAFFALIF